MKKTFEVIAENGLHARPAAELSREASRWPCSIKICSPVREVDAKSIMGLLTLAAGKGTHLDVTVTGEREDMAMAAIEAFLTTGLARVLDE